MPLMLLNGCPPRSQKSYTAATANTDRKQQEQMKKFFMAFRWSSQMRNVRASVETVGITGIPKMIFIADMQKGQKMANISVPIQVNLPDDWLEQIIDRLKNDPDAEWAEVVRCQNCKYWEGFKKNGIWRFDQCSIIERTTSSDDFCSWAKRREE